MRGLILAHIVLYANTFISYLQSVDRICAPDYLPSNKDILLSRVKTTGMTETTFVTKDNARDETMQLRVYDFGGIRSQRKYWNDGFEAVDIILFTVDIACYDQLLFEDEGVNRMQEALTAFKSIVNWRSFTRTKIVLCFTKRNKLAEKIKYSPFEAYFPDFVPTQPPSLQDTMAYIIARFTNLSQREGTGTDRFISTVVLQDTLSSDEWLVIKQMAWRLCDNKVLQSTTVKSGSERQPLRTWRAFRRVHQRREAVNLA